MLRLSLLITILSLAQFGVAHAHFGHVGELAGHRHLIGLGALLGAAALAAALRKPKNTEEVESDEEEPVAEGEAA